MDSKISEFPVAATVAATAIIPVVVDGVNKSLSVGILSLNLPNFGNKGITKNVVIQASGAAIPLTGTLVTLPVLGVSYTLQNGSDGQEITLVSLGNNVVVVGSVQINMSNESVVTLLYLNTLSKWIITSEFGQIT